MADNDPQLNGPLPGIPRNEPITEIGRDVSVKGECRNATRPALRTEDFPGANVEKILHRRCLAPDTIRGKPPYDESLYIERGK